MIEEKYLDLEGLKVLVDEIQDNTKPEVTKKDLNDLKESILGDATEAFDTLQEVEEYIKEHGTEASEMITAINQNKSDISKLNSHFKIYANEGERFYINDNLICFSGINRYDSKNEFSLYGVGNYVLIDDSDTGTYFYANRKPLISSYSNAITYHGFNGHSSLAKIDFDYNDDLKIKGNNILISCDNILNLEGSKISLNGLSFWKGTQDEYDLIVTKDPSTLYIITD